MKPLSVAIIGAGNMGGAVAIGLHRFAPEYSLTVTTAHASTLEKYAALGIQTSLDNVAAALSADVVILGVKPWLVQSVILSLLTMRMVERYRNIFPPYSLVEVYGDVDNDVHNELNKIFRRLRPGAVPLR